MTQDQYSSLVRELDDLMSKCKALIPERYQGDKMMLFQKFREVNHWMRDCFEISELEKAQQHLEEKYSAKSGLEPSSSN